MKRFAALLSMVLLAGVMQAMAAGLTTKSEAEQDALNAVGGGIVDQAYREKEMGKLIWSVDITDTTDDHEVWVDAHTGAILRVSTQPSSPDARKALISKAQAEQDALKAVGGGKVLQAQLDEWKGNRIWDVDVSQPGVEYTVYVDAHSGAILKIMEQLQPAGAKFISQAQAVKIALNAVGGGQALLAVLDKTDNPPNWSVDVLATSGAEFEVKVNAYTGKVIAIIPGG
jgi:uncharacterized membrane protein YkoI